MKLLRSIITSSKTRDIAIMLVLILAGVTHGFNMLHFPYFENDEGSYMSQAWSLVKHGELAPYTYWYDHAPAGWMFIALWTLLTGGFFTFGTSIDTGRVFMLVIHVISSLLLLLIGRRLTGRTWPGILAVLLFSLSPLAIYFQRRILLDNLMVFWILLSFWLLLKEKFSLKYVYLSALSFGVAVLTKENAVFFLPGFLYVLYLKSHSFHRRFAFIKWLAISFSLISLYFLYALLKSEFFPVGFMHSTSDHVSLLSTLELQNSRGNSLPFWNMHSEFYPNLLGWLQKDAKLIGIAGITFLLGLLMAIKNKGIRMLMVFIAGFLVFLLRGKLIIEFYIVPLIPFIALLYGVIIDQLLTKAIGKRIITYTVTMLCIATAMIGMYLSGPLYHFTNDETKAHREVLSWIKQNLSSSDSIIIDVSMYVDLHDSKNPEDKTFPNAHWYSKIDKDPAIRTSAINDDWTNISYIALSHEMIKQMSIYTLPFLRKAVPHAYPIVTFVAPNNHTQIDVKNLVSTNGDWMAVYKVASDDQLQLETSWDTYKKAYIHSYGQVVNPLTKSTSSLDQTNAMLRAVWANDQITFDGLWSWTKDHMQHREGDLLLSSTWKNDRLTNYDSTVEADQDAALALLLAYKKWGKNTYKQEAVRLIKDIYKYEVQGTTVLSGTGNKKPDILALAPASYKVFAQFDTTNPWEAVADASYARMQVTQTSASPQSCFTPETRLVLDALWFTDQRAIELLDENPTSSESASVPLLTVTDKNAADVLYQKEFLNSYSYDTGLVKNRTSYYQNNCNWLTTVLYYNMLP